MFASLVNSVQNSVKTITRTCLAFGRQLVTSLCAISKSAPPVVGLVPFAAPPRHVRQQPVAQLSAAAHWARVSAVVERSVERAHGIGEQQSAARQQLDAAEYTLHRLIEELNEVMMSPVQLPKRADRAVTIPAPSFVSALAA